MYMVFVFVFVGCVTHKTEKFNTTISLVHAHQPVSAFLPSGNSLHNNFFIAEELTPAILRFLTPFPFSKQPFATASAQPEIINVNI